LALQCGASDQTGDVQPLAGLILISILQYYDLWRNYSLRMFLTHKDAIALLKSLNAQPGALIIHPCPLV